MGTIEKCRRPLEKTDKDRFMMNSKGSLLINLVIILLVTSVVGVTLISLTSTTTVQQVFSDTSQRADLLAQSGFRYMASQYRQAATEIGKNGTLKQLNGKTYSLSGNDGTFTLTVYPYYYQSQSLIHAGVVQLPLELPGSRPSSMVVPVSGTLGVLSGSQYSLYTYAAVTGTGPQYTFNGLSPALKSDITAGSTVNQIFTPETKVLNNGNGNSLQVAGIGNFAPSQNGVFDVINSSGFFKDKNGAKTVIYMYKSRNGDVLQDISVYKEPETSFSVSLDSTTRIVVHRSARIDSRGTADPGLETEVNRTMSGMVALGENLATVMTSDLIYTDSANILTGLIDSASVLGDTSVVTNGKSGNAMTFDGNRDYIRLNDTAALDLTSSGSLGAWIKVDVFDNNFAGLIRKGGMADDSDLAYSLQIRSNNKVRLVIVGTSSSLTLDSGSTLTTGIWYHVVGTWGPAGMRIYIDGQLDNSRPETLMVRNTTGTVQIGAQLDEDFNPSQKNFGFHGLMDEVFIYNTQKNICEIRTIFSNPCNTGCDAYAYYPYSGSYDDVSGEDKEGVAAHRGSPSGTSFDTDRFGCSQSACQLQLWDYVSMTPESDFDMSGAFTIAFWVRVGNWSLLLGDDPFVGKGSDSYRVQRYNFTNNATFGTTSLSTVETRGNDNIGDGSWHHIAVVYTGSQKILYVDGVADATSNNVTGTLHQNNNDLRVGSLGLFSVFTGWVDDLAIWKRALSQSEISNVYKGIRTDPSLP